MKYILVVVFTLSLAFNLYSKTEVSEKETKGYYEVTYIDETPVPAVKSSDNDRGFIYFERSVLERIYRETVPKKNEIKDTVSISIAKDEYEPVQIGIYPLKDIGDVELLASDLTDSNGNKIDKSNVDIKVVRYLGQGVGLNYMKYFMVIPKTIEKMEKLDIKKGVTRALWVTIKAPASAKPGNYKAEINLKSEGIKNGKFTLEVEVLPFAVVSNPKIIYAVAMTYEFNGIYNAKGKDADKMWELAEKNFIDMKEHGMTAVFPHATAACLEQDGHPYLPDLEANLKLAKKVGFTKPVIWYEGPVLKSAKVKNLGNIKEYKSSVHPALAKNITRYYDAYCKKEGYPGVIYLPIDEPGLNDGLADGDAPDKRQKIAYELYKEIKAAGGETLLTCTPESIKNVENLVDWWVMAWITPELAANAKAKNAKLGIYPNGAVMGQGTVSTRLSFGYYAWANNLDAVTPWTYPVSAANAPLNFMRKGEGKTKAKDGYIGLDGKPVTIIQWELVREGIDDAKYLYTLETSVKEAKKSAINNPAVKEAENLIASIKENVEAASKNAKYEHYATGEILEQKIWNPAKFEQLRKQISELIKKLKG